MKVFYSLAEQVHQSVQGDETYRNFECIEIKKPEQFKNIVTSLERVRREYLLDQNPETGSKEYSKISYLFL